MKATECEEFYLKTDEMTERIRHNFPRESQSMAPDKIKFEAPLILNPETAYDWLFTNYALATNFSYRKPPAMGEVSFFLSDSKREGENGIIIPQECFDFLRRIFPLLRVREREFDDVNCNGYYRHFLGNSSGLDVVEGCADFSVTSADNSDIVARNGLWEMRTPGAILYDQKLTRKGAVYRLSGHTHVGNVDWMDLLPTDGDFIIALYYREHNDEKPIHREDIMHFPLRVLEKLNAALQQRSQANDRGGVQEILGNKGYLDEALENDMLGMRITWNMPRKRLVVRPIVSEPHYMRARGRVPEGTALDVKGCYVDTNADFSDCAEHKPCLMDARSYVRQCAV